MFGALHLPFCIDARIMISVFFDETSIKILRIL